MIFACLSDVVPSGVRSDQLLYVGLSARLRLQLARFTQYHNLIASTVHPVHYYIASTVHPERKSFA